MAEIHISFMALKLAKKKKSAPGFPACIQEKKNEYTHSCTARAIDSAVEPVSLTLSKVTFGRSSSSLSLLICLGDRPLGSMCAVRMGHRHGRQTHETGAGAVNL